MSENEKPLPPPPPVPGATAKTPPPLPGGGAPPLPGAKMPPPPPIKSAPPFVPGAAVPPPPAAAKPVAPPPLPSRAVTPPPSPPSVPPPDVHDGKVSATPPLSSSPKMPEQPQVLTPPSATAPPQGKGLKNVVIGLVAFSLLTAGGAGYFVWEGKKRVDAAETGRIELEEQLLQVRKELAQRDSELSALLEQEKKRSANAPESEIVVTQTSAFYNIDQPMTVNLTAENGVASYMQISKISIMCKNRQICEQIVPLKPILLDRLQQTMARQTFSVMTAPDAGPKFRKKLEKTISEVLGLDQESSEIEVLLPNSYLIQ